MYEYLRSWTGVAVRPAPGALKNTGVINELLLGRRPVRSALEKREAANTFTGLMNEFDMKLINGMAQGPLYRLLTLTAVQQASFVKDQIYVSPCFEAYSKDRLVPGGNFAAANSASSSSTRPFPGLTSPISTRRRRRY